jgi:glutamate carboxypeptidase
MAQFAADEVRIVGWLAARRDQMLSLLAELVNIDSGTSDVAGVEAVAERIESFLRQSGLESVSIAGPPHGRGLRVELAGRIIDRSVLLMGHLDTVFPIGEARRRPFALSDGRATGPGVADMKAGLVMNSFVLAAFSACGGNRRSLVGLYTGDEEIGSPSYRPIIEAEASRADYAFNAEPGRISGNVVLERRGGAFLRLSIEGKAAHSGIDVRAGVSAIEELAHKILALHALTDFDADITVNVGVVAGGQSVNTTAPNAEALIDLRFAKPDDRERMMTAISAIVAKRWIPGASARLDVTGEFLPLVPTLAATALFERYRTAANDLGFAVNAEATGACADAGFAAAAGATTLCGVGPVGGNAHSPAEYVDVETVAPRAQALALTILRLERDADRSDAGARPSHSSSLSRGENEPASQGTNAAKQG